MSDTVRLLELRVERAIARLKQLSEERDRLASEVATLQDRVRALEAAEPSTSPPSHVPAWPGGMIEELREVVRGLRGE